MDAVLEVRDLAYGTPEGRLLQEGLSFTVAPGGMLLITGSNGCGKSTLLKALMADIPVERGEIRCGVPKEKTEYIPQLENTEIHFPLTLRDVLSISRGKRVTWETVSSFGLLKEHQLDAAWNTASGGERKRTLLLRALLKAPRLLVFDEPMNHLDAESRRAMTRVMAAFLDASTEPSPRAIVMVCHQGLSEEERGLFDVCHIDLDPREQVC